MNQTRMKHKINNWRYNWRKKPFVTYILLAIMIVMYLLMTINGGSENPFVLMLFGAKVNQLIVIGQWWRLITPAFLHIGLSHILFNGIIVYYLGAQLESIIGHFRYFLLFLFSALLGNAASFAFNASISAGASTAIFGFFASTLVLAKFYPYQSGIQHLSRNYMVLMTINIIWGFLSPAIDNAGHIGGLIGGYLIMYVLSAPNVKNHSIQERIMYGVFYLVALMVCIAVGVFRTRLF